MTDARPSPEQLNQVFGEGAGGTAEERAATSKSLFVRSQVQLAPYSEGATGRVLTALEAVKAFGWAVVRTAVLEGSAPLITSPNEPSATLRARREQLGLTIEQVAKRLGIENSTVEQLEKPGIRNPIRTLESFAQILALDEKILGWAPHAGQDSPLGVRLREMSNSGHAGFTGNTVVQLSEAAWVIARQAELQKLLGKTGLGKVRLPRHNNSFGYPVYETGYHLAEQARRDLGLDAEQPIDSVRKIVEDDYGLPLVQLQMSPRFAGATLANGAARGIVINEAGMNSNVWVRRMTMCHELGHLLYDPDTALERIKVDAYDELELSDRDVKRDAAESRANAFAVAFLAPPSAVRRIASTTADPSEVVTTVMTAFGISATAARHHVRNITMLETFSNWFAAPEPDDQWIVMENLTLDYFPIPSVALSRRGKFSWCVAKAVEQGYITDDSACSWLAVKATDVPGDSLGKIAALRD